MRHAEIGRRREREREREREGVLCNIPMATLTCPNLSLFRPKFNLKNDVKMRGAIIIFVDYLSIKLC